MDECGGSGARCYGLDSTASSNSVMLVITASGRKGEAFDPLRAVGQGDRGDVRGLGFLDVGCRNTNEHSMFGGDAVEHGCLRPA